jgi:hypothetical protein
MQLFSLALVICLGSTLCTCFFTGCGSGSGAGGSSGSGSAGSGIWGAGRISIDVPFPARNSRGSARITGTIKHGRALASLRDVPGSVQFYGIWIFDMGTTNYAVPPVRVDRPSTGTSATVVIDNVPVGWKTVRIVASDGSNAIAESSTNIYVEAGANNPAITVTMSPLPTPSSSASPSPSPSPSLSPSPSPSLSPSPSPSPSISPSPNPSPSLSAVSPLQGPIGTTVTLTGTNLGTSGAIFIGGTMVPAAQVVWGSTTITFIVPSGIAAGLQTVDVMPTGSTATASIQFTVTSSPPPPAAPWREELNLHNFNFYFYGVSFVSPTQGYAVGAEYVGSPSTPYPRLYKYNGTTWTKFTSASPPFNDTTAMVLTAVHCDSAGNIVIVGYDNSLSPGPFGKVYYSNNGTNWYDVSPINMTAFYGVDFLASSTTGWIIGAPTSPLSGNLHIRYTTLGGAPPPPPWGWLLQPLPPMPGNANLNGIHFYNGSTGCTVGSGGLVMRTGDTGSSWASMLSSTSEDLFGIHFLAGGEGWAVGTNETIIHTGPEAVLPPSGGGLDWAIQNGPGSGVTLHGIACTGPAYAWAAGGSYATPATGKVLKLSSPVTGTWSVVYTGTQPLTSIYFTDNNNGWAVGDEGIIIRTKTGGL